MKKKVCTGILAAAMWSLTPIAMAADPEACLDCHEPAEDWQGMSAQEILAEAKDPGNKRHKDFADLTDEQLKAMIATLKPE